MTKPAPPWSDNLNHLRASLIAQVERIRSGSPHSTIKGTSVEVVVRRTLREYVPAYFTIGSGQAMNNSHEASPQLDVIVYDHNAFPHLSVNEDGSVIVCCESLLAAIECKMQWDRDRLVQHFSNFTKVESKRHQNYASSSNAAAYFVVAFEGPDLGSTDLSGFEDESRTVGIYTLKADGYRLSLRGKRGFESPLGNGFALLLQDILLDCMEKGQKDVGDFMAAFQVVKTYFGENSYAHESDNERR